MMSLPPPTPQPAVPQLQQQATTQPVQSQQLQPSALQQSAQTPQLAQQQQPAPLPLQPLINHPVSIAAAAAIAVSAGMVNPSEWNALASSSMVTLEDLRDAFVEQKKKQLRELQEAHKKDLRELLFMSETYDKDEANGSPFKLPRNSMAVATDDPREHVTNFLKDYELTESNTKSIRQLVLLQPKALRDRLTKELGTGPIESAPPPTPTTSASMASAVEAQRERERQKEQEVFNKAAAMRSAAVAQAASAAQTKAQAEGVGKLEPLAIAMSRSQSQSQASSIGGSQHTTPLILQLPMTLGSLPALTMPSGSALSDASSQGLNIAVLAQQSAIPASASSAAQQADLVPNLLQAQSQTSPEASLTSPLNLAEAGPSGSPSSSPSKPTQPGSLQKAVSPAPGLAPSAASEVPGFRLPPSPTAAPVLPETAEIPPLDPTLQKLAPNPLSVTYAASLRPLPPDPNRRITGSGIGGGAIHHRGGRKVPPPGTTNGLGGGNGSSGASIGPAGSGQTDLWRWYVRARASPGAGMVGKADKCLMTNDWKVAFNEQRFVRAMARIEKLKNSGEWSFRQPKKQKGPVVHRAHWDHLLEEMKWIQTDFREERRWKLAVAFQLAHEIAAWHRAKAPAERAAFCISTRGPRKNASSPAAADRAQVVESAAAAEVDTEADVDMAGPTAEDETEVQEEAEEDDARQEDAEKDMETDETVTAAVDQAVEDAVITMAEEADADGEDVDAEGEDDDAEGDEDDGEVEAATAALVTGEPLKPPKVEVVHEPRAPEASMPVLASSASNAQEPTDVDPAATNDDDDAPDGVRTEAPGKDATLAVELPPELISTLRAPIFSMDISTAIVSPSALLDSLNPEAVAAMLGISIDELPAAAQALDIDELSFSEMFSELPLFGAPFLPDATSKSDRRWDEGSLNQPPRLTHVTKLLDSKPLLVSTLEPSKNRAQGRWLDDSDWIVAAEQSDPLRGMPDGVDPTSGVPPLPGSLLFARRSNKASREPAQPVSGVPIAPASPDARAALFVWTPEEDNYLLTLAKQYNNNWSLVSDLFNSTRLTIPTDRREAWDCYDRCKRIHQAAEEGKPPPGPPQLAPTVSSGTPDKDKKNDDALKDSDLPAANNSLAAKRDKLNKKLGSKYDGSKKKLRRANLMEVMRKSSKRREVSKQAQQSQVKKVNLTSHETHAQIKAGLAASPQTLSALKQERDQAALRQYYEHQRAQLAFQQQQQQQAQRMLAQQAQSQSQTPQGQRATQPNVPQPQQPQQSQQQVSQQQSQVQAQQQQVQAQQPQAQQQQQHNQAAQMQASQAAQMQNLYAHIQQQQQHQQLQLQQPQMVQQQRPPLTQQQLQQLTPQQLQQYHAQLAAAAAAAQQQQLRAQQQAKTMQFSVPQAQSQFQQQQQQQQQFGGVKPLVTQERPVQQQQQQQQRAMNSASPAPGQQGSPIPPGMPSTIQALQQQLAISLASSNLSPEQINGLAIQLFKQAQTSYGQQQAAQKGNAASPCPMPQQQQQGGQQPPQQ